MKAFQGKLEACYQVSIMFVTALALLVSGILSILFWLSFSTSSYLTILLILFALVFEISKIYAFIECYISKTLGNKVLKLSIYIFLTFISILGSAGGLHSLLNQSQAKVMNQSVIYQQYKYQIQQTGQLIDTDKKLAQSDLENDYRTKAGTLLIHEIPRLQDKLEQLQQSEEKISQQAKSPVSLASNILPYVAHISPKYSRVILVVILAIIIDLIAAFLIGLCMSKRNVFMLQNISENVSGVENISDTKKPLEIINNSFESATFSDNSVSIKDRNSLEDLFERVKKNIERKVYEPKVTRIQKFEKIGYGKAKLALSYYFNSS